MANKCAICGAEVNLIQGQKLADGNYICRKNCRSKCMKVFDCVHADLNQVQAHIAQVERGTKLWEHYFVPKLKEKDKEKKLHNFTGNIYIAPDIGLMAMVQVTYKFMFFGKETRGLPEDFLEAHYDACVRIPMRESARSLNLSNAVAVTVFEALRQLDFPNLRDYGKMRG